MLEIEAIRNLLDSAFAAAAEKERLRQAASDRAQEHLLDLRVHVAFEAISVSLLANKTGVGGGGEEGEALVRLDITNIDGHMSVWSDTAWNTGLVVSDLNLRDVATNSRNIYKELVRPSWPAGAEPFMVPFLLCQVSFITDCRSLFPL